MTVERMTRFLCLSEIFKTTSSVPQDREKVYEMMWIEYELLRDEFIKQFELPITPIKNPVTDTKKADA